MKKIYTLVSGLLIGSIAVAQQLPGSQSTPEEKPNHTKVVEKAQLKASSSRAIQKRWLDHDASYALFYGAAPDGIFHFLFPDSLVKFQTSTGLSDPFVHSMGQVFDLKSPVWNNGTDYTPSANHTFTIDSVAALGFYNRVDNGVVDTLVFRILIPGSANLGSSYYFSGMSADYGVDTVRFIGMDYDHTTNSAPGAVEVIKVPLDASTFADSTANGLHWIQVAVPNGGVTVPLQTVNTYRGVFGVTVDYIPGGPYAATDTLGVNRNAWMFTTFELNGPDTYPYYLPGDWNSSHSVQTSTRYNYPGNGWNGLYIPTWAWVQAGWLESHGIYPLISQDDGWIGINETAEGSVSVYPNPAGDNVAIEFTVDGAGYSMQITDITGKVIRATDFTAASGEQRINLSTADYENGVYFVTVNNGAESFTTRLVIAK